MMKQDFIDLLNKDPTDITMSDKLKVCQYYIDNYPIITKDGKTRLMTTIKNGSDQKITFAYTQLKKRLKEFNDG